uniref:Elongator complex protein 5 n=1 Tax=Chelonoidis abingdonii TaxID=106734 RepID=A0A8C0IWG2_CHEAB
MWGETISISPAPGPFPADTAECEGRSLLKTFVAASAHRGESVHVFGFEIPEEEFRAGFDPDVTVRLLYQDGFTDPLRWTGEAGGFGAEEFTALGVAGRLARGPAGPTTVVLDSLSWLLLRQPLPAVCQTLGQIPRAATSLRVTRILALLHEDLHPPGLVETLRSLARAVVGVGPAPEGMGSGGDAPHLASMLQRKGTGKVLKKVGEGKWRCPDWGVDPAANLTFNLRLSDTERRARDGMSLPFHFTVSGHAPFSQPAHFSQATPLLGPPAQCPQPLPSRPCPPFFFLPVPTAVSGPTPLPLAPPTSSSSIQSPLSL